MDLNLNAEPSCFSLEYFSGVSCSLKSKPPLQIQIPIEFREIMAEDLVFRAKNDAFLIRGGKIVYCSQSGSQKVLLFVFALIWRLQGCPL